MVYGFTGSSTAGEDARGVVRRIIEDLEGPEMFVTGSQVGIDQIAAEEAMRAFPDAKHLQIVPGAPGTHGDLLPDAYVLQLPRCETRAEAYRARNEEIVQTIYEAGLVSGAVLIALPEGAEGDYPRSGTWMTVRIARAAPVPVREHRLDRER